VDGLVRDVEGHRELGFFLFSQGRTVNGAREHAVPGQLQQPVVVDGVTVYPRDWVVADVDGVVFIPQNRLDEVIKMAEEIYLDIAEMIEAMGNGAPLHQAMKDIQFRG
jgi:4-hydroxy-4-methyl-2-oxoglutarate aldolase